MEQQPLYQSNFRQENQFSLKNRKNFISSNLLLIIAQIIVWGFLIYTFIEHDFYPAFIFAYVIMGLSRDLVRVIAVILCE